MKYIVYKTTCLINNKNYIGIHQTDNLNDGYLGSGVAFKRAIKKYGKENFVREIIEECNSFDELLGREKFYVNEEWVKNQNNYNLKTGGQSSGILSKESRNKISNTLKMKYESGEIVKNYNTPYIATEEQKQQISETLKERYKNQEHHLKGVEPWNKGKKGVQIGWNKGLKTPQTGLHRKGIKIGPMSEENKEKISEALKEYYKENKHPTKGLEPWNKGVTMSKTECPHCNKMVDTGNGKRWHFDNCKLNVTDAYAASSCADRLC